MGNHPCDHGNSFLVDLIVAKNLHLAAEQLRGAAVSHRQHATALGVCSQSSFGQHMKIVFAAGDSERSLACETRSQFHLNKSAWLALASLDAVECELNLSNALAVARASA